ncbi:hypothetical protein [Streptomyces xanthochromogenes]|uniref:hypothetical protein n=1 Tax=Streptomyces xanthochromogenes TaxID=67384 RepID=UPI002F3EE734
MNRNAKKGRLDPGPSQKVSAASGSTTTSLPQTADNRQLSARPLVLITRGRVEFTAKCPGCSNWHRHRKLGDVEGPCGTQYELQPRAKRRAA